MGAGFAQIGMLILLTIIGLPLFFFALMAALDRFERTLSASPRTVAAHAAAPVDSAGLATPTVAVEMPDAAILTLPSTVSIAASGPVSSAPSGAGAKPAAAI
jgi:hypothetical protein